MTKLPVISGREVIKALAKGRRHLGGPVEIGSVQKFVHLGEKCDDPTPSEY